MSILKKLIRASALTCAVSIAAAGTAYAAKPGCDSDPVKPIPDGGQDFRNVSTEHYITHDGHRYNLLDIRMADNRIGGCDVNLRSYNGQLVGDTLRVRQGETLRVWMTNNLPANPRNNQEANINIPPHMPNTTNFHAHGFHVSPDGIADNVLRLMPPKVEDDEDKDATYLGRYGIRNVPRGAYPVVIEVPENHPTGTFWYHAHVHGSTAMQVSSGMAGALIVEPGPGPVVGPPSLDTNAKIAKAKDQIMLFQQIAYNDDGVINDYKTLETKVSWWAASNRRTTINGQIAPVIKMQPGEVQRWRMIHGGVNEAININIEGEEKIKLQEIATDGLASGRCDEWDYVTLYPGYRSDVLVKAPSKPGSYLLVDATSDATTSLLGNVEGREVLAKIEIAGSAVNMELPCQPGELAKYKAMKDIDPQAQATVQQTVAFAFQNVSDTLRYGTVDTGDGPTPYNPDAPALKLYKGDVGKWKLSTGSHPFHIHVNAFQTERPGPGATAADPKTQIVWRDTLFTGIFTPESVDVYTRYETFTGTFVLHCHILQHEDIGMMRKVEIVDK